jgi:O-antigen ligase
VSDATRTSPLLTPTWANLQLALVVVMLIASNLSIAVSQLALGLALVVQLVRRLMLRTPLVPTGLGRWVLALAAWAALMIPFSSDPGQSLVFYKRFFLFAAIWVTAGVAFDTRRQMVLFGSILLGGLAATIWGQIHLLMRYGSLFGQRLGEMSNPMTSGCLIMMTLLLAAGFLLRGRLSRRLLVPVVIVTLFLALALVQTMTRSAWLGVFTGLAVMLLLARPRLFGVFAVLVAAVLIAAPNLPDTMTTPKMKKRLDVTYLLQGNSTSQRVFMWNEGWAMVRRHPVTGVGDRDLRAIGPDYYQHPEINYKGHLHSNPVMLAAIWGVPGFLLGMGFLVWQAVLLFRRWRKVCKDGPTVAAAWQLAALGVWAGFFVAGLTEWYFGDAESMLLYLAMTGLALGLPLTNQSAEASHV